MFFFEEPIRLLSFTPESSKEGGSFDAKEPKHFFFAVKEAKERLSLQMNPSMLTPQAAVSTTVGTEPIGEAFFVTFARHKSKVSPPLLQRRSFDSSKKEQEILSHFTKEKGEYPYILTAMR